MTSKDFVQMSPQLRKSLNDIIVNKGFVPESNELKWEELRELLSARIECLFEELNPSSTSDDTEIEIKKNTSKFKELFQTRFKDSPPFTILRISELILNPISQEYDISKSPLKYLSALKTNIFVASTVSDYPRSPEKESHGDEVSSDSEKDPKVKVLPISSEKGEMQTIRMTEIPWLNEINDDEPIGTAAKVEEEKEIDLKKDEDKMTDSPEGKGSNSKEVSESDISLDSPLKINEALESRDLISSSPLKRETTIEEENRKYKKAKANEMDDDQMDISNGSLNDTSEHAIDLKIKNDSMDRMDISAGEIISDEEPLMKPNESMLTTLYEENDNNDDDDDDDEKTITEDEVNNDS